MTPERMRQLRQKIREGRDLTDAEYREIREAVPYIAESAGAALEYLAESTRKAAEGMRGLAAAFRQKEA
jgi:hypothetical protein